MKKIVIVNLCLLLFIFFTAGMKAVPASDSAKIEELMKERIGILNYYYGGKMSFEDARKNIEKIEKSTLLAEDLDLMKSFVGEAIDQIADYAFLSTTCKRSSFGILNGEVEIYWVLQGENGRWETEETYYFTAEDSDGKVKLTQLKKL